MKLTEAMLKKMILEEVTREKPSEEVKKQIYANLNKHNGNTLPFEELEAWEVREGERGYDSKISVKVGDKQFYGEI